MDVIKLILLISVMISSFTGSVFSQAGEAYERQINLLFAMLEKNHYHPVELSPQKKKDIMVDFVQAMDPYGFYFHSKDVAAIAGYSGNLKDNIPDAYAFLDTVFTMYEQRLQAADSLLNVIKNSPFDYKKEESLLLPDEDSAVYAKNGRGLQEKWRKWLKFSVLRYAFSEYEELDSAIEITPEMLLSKEPEMKQKAVDKERQTIADFLNPPAGFEDHVVSLLMNSIAASYDPHTIYFSKGEKQAFEASLSKEAYLFGLQITENPLGEIAVERLVPGGPAWKSNELHKGDIIISIHLENGPSLLMEGRDIYEIQEIIRTSPSDKMTLKVKKQSGQIKEVVLMREKIEVDENKITGFILNGEKKIGYFALPAFYTEFEQENALGCANDVAKELLKLKREDIDGLIFDLRNNTGGSMIEALDLAGIFIGEGPLSLYRSREGKPRLLKDLNRGTIYDGPLVILVNRFSASASEILSAALQDYNRAVIVGSPTFGKATGQIVLPLDTGISLENYYEKGDDSYGYIKITMKKLYRIPGNTHQLTGVIPDVILPGNLLYMEYGESKYPTALSSDSVDKKVYYDPLPALPVDELAGKSRARVEADSNFNALRLLNDSLRQIIKNPKPVPLQPELFIERAKRREIILDRMINLPSRPAAAYKVENTSYDEALIMFDDHKKAINKVLVKNISEDIYIEEAYQIIKDLIIFTSK